MTLQEWLDWYDSLDDKQKQFVRDILKTLRALGLSMEQAAKYVRQIMDCIK